MSIAKVNSRHRRMMEALVLEGKRPVEVAMEFGVTESRLSILRRSPLWKAEEEALRQESLSFHRTTLQRLLPRALNVAEDLLETDDERLRHNVARDIMNRAGLTGDMVVSNGAGLSVRVVLED